MKTFKQPLSPERESHYLSLAEAGDMNAKNILIEYNLRLVAHIAKKYYTPGKCLEDLISIGTIGLIKAINTFKNEKGNRLVTYASRCIENELLMYFRQERKESRETSLCEPIGIDKEGNEICLMDILHSEKDSTLATLIKNEQIARISSVFSKVLDAREQEILKLRYGLDHENEYTQKEIAEKLSISRSYVSRIEKKALLKLRSALNG